MQIKKKGISLAMLSAALLTGCSANDTLYTAGIEIQSDSAEEAKEDETAAFLTEDGPEEILDMIIESVPEQTGYVYVCGAVNNPGVYPIYENMRICDAIEAAGGFADGADEEWLNQASVVADGQKLYVYTLEETLLLTQEGVTSADVMTAQDAADGISDGRININTATKEQLMSLPGIGESRAILILEYRSDHGSFASIEEIQNISGIKSGVFSKIKDMITV